MRKNKLKSEPKNQKMVEHDRHGNDNFYNDTPDRQIEEAYSEREDSNQGKVYDYEATIPIFALSFSEKQNNNDQSILMGVGSYLTNSNCVQILRMNEHQGI